MLSQLQSSINMLSAENRKILDENINLRVENAQLKSNQEEMLLKLSQLTREVERLRKLINGKERNAKDYKNGTVVGRRSAGRLRGTEDRNVGKDRTDGIPEDTEDSGSGESGDGSRSQGSQGEQPGTDPDGADDGGYTGICGIDGTDGGEPP